MHIVPGEQPGSSPPRFGAVGFYLVQHPAATIQRLSAWISRSVSSMSSSRTNLSPSPKHINMSFGGSAAGMNHSIQANRALRRGRNSLFERPVTRSHGHRKNSVEADPVPKHVREKFTQKLAREQQVEAFKFLLSVLLAIG